jgi:hypothetical protein
MVLTPYDLFSWNKHNINFDIINEHLNTLLKAFEDAHSVHAGSSSSRLTLPSFFLMLHVASFLAGGWYGVFYKDVMKCREDVIENDIEFGYGG